MIDTLKSGAILTALDGAVAARLRRGTGARPELAGSLPVVVQMRAVAAGSLDTSGLSGLASNNSSNGFAGTDHTTGLPPRAAPV